MGQEKSEESVGKGMPVVRWIWCNLPKHSASFHKSITHTCNRKAIVWYESPLIYSLLWCRYIIACLCCSKGQSVAQKGGGEIECFCSCWCKSTQLQSGRKKHWLPLEIPLTQNHKLLAQKAHQTIHSLNCLCVFGSALPPFNPFRNKKSADALRPKNLNMWLKQSRTERWAWSLSEVFLIPYGYSINQTQSHSLTLF